MGLKHMLDGREAYEYARQVGYTEPVRIRALVAKYGPLVLTCVPMAKINVWDSYLAALEYATDGKIDWGGFNFGSINPQTEAQRQAAIKAIKSELTRPLDKERLAYYREHGGKVRGQVNHFDFHIFKFRRLLKHLNDRGPVTPAIADALYDNGKLGLADGNHRAAAYHNQGKPSMRVYVPQQLLEYLEAGIENNSDLPEVGPGKLGKGLRVVLQKRQLTAAQQKEHHISELLAGLSDGDLINISPKILARAVEDHRLPKKMAVNRQALKGWLLGMIRNTLEKMPTETVLSVRGFQYNPEEKAPFRVENGAVILGSEGILPDRAGRIVFLWQAARAAERDNAMREGAARL